MNKQHRFDEAWQGFIRSIQASRRVPVTASVDYKREEVVLTDTSGNMRTYTFFDEVLDGHNDLFTAIHAWANQRGYEVMGIVGHHTTAQDDRTGENSYLLYLEDRYLSILASGGDMVTDQDPGDEQH